MKLCAILLLTNALGCGIIGGPLMAVPGRFSRLVKGSEKNFSKNIFKKSVDKIPKIAYTLCIDKRYGGLTKCVKYMN
jgi:hypothetical protein